ncbi:replication stress response regulator SDE2-like [Salvia splendens]|uniref:replication stress response regulator SDE2-like n=1 Tax=Salvia splendens TaxID=180675 RepID=UPI001C26809A|nr:replication stress response regulator SDE2-like [Salvia splendens]
MDAFESEIHQVFVKLLDGSHRILNFDAPSVSISALKRRIEALTSIPSGLQLLLNSSRILDDHQTLILGQNFQSSETLIPNSSSEIGQDRGFTRSRSDGFGNFPVVVNLLLRLRGGKGGFGSLLRGAATKAGQKKTNNFDACRDMSGRRLRHVNAEKKLEEWKAGAEERRLEKMADEFLKKKAKEIKKSGKGNGGDGAEKYVAKYREDSEKCREEVERSVRESVKGLMSSKRKNQDEGNESASKKLKIWFGKRKLGDSDSEEDEDEDGACVKEEKNEGSVIIDDGNHSDSSKEVGGSSGSVASEELGAGTIEQGSSGIYSEEEGSEESLKSTKGLDGCGEDGDSKNGDTHVIMIESPNESKDNNGVVSPSKSHPSEVHEVISQPPGTSGSEDEVVLAGETRGVSAVESASASASLENVVRPLNFDDYNSATMMEVLGLERLKSELQAHGLKCGGTLKERAERLFLLKTTPLEMLPKKLFAKK